MSGWNVANPRETQLEIAAAFAALPIAIEIKTDAGLVGIVHADCPFPSWQQFTGALEDRTLSKNVRDSIIDLAQWSRDRITAMEHETVGGVLAVVVGHTPVERFTSLGNVLYIDTGGWLRGRDFTILDAATLRPVDLRKRLQWETKA
ncbi:hypothetical protein [Cupriavidus sp. BIC8F]|uniref:hypothetical protein n=1 Tax=Cupriavidus sp. BIC8F TaxID=3079014 RepID=UPI0029160BC0|nr:hypothetical protein [Cupriavidus sp. BIC8F]